MGTNSSILKTQILTFSNAGAVNTLNLPELMMDIWAKPTFFLCLIWVRMLKVQNKHVSFKVSDPKGDKTACNWRKDISDQDFRN